MESICRILKMLKSRQSEYCHVDSEYPQYRWALNVCILGDERKEYGAKRIMWIHQSTRSSFYEVGILHNRQLFTVLDETVMGSICL
jgi:hypothetical protein